MNAFRIVRKLVQAEVGSEHRLAVLLTLGTLLFVWNENVYAGECLLNYRGWRTPLAPEGPLVQLIRKEQHDASLRAIRATAATRGNERDAYLPDESEVLAALVKMPVISRDDCGAPFYAAAFGFPRTLEAFIDRKVNAKAGKPQSDGMNALMAAAMEGHLSTVRVLIERNIFAVDDRNALYFYAPWLMPAIGGGETALHIAAAHGHRDIVKYLVSKGAEVNARSNDRRTPLDMARHRDDSDMVQLLVELGAR